MHRIAFAIFCSLAMPFCARAESLKDSTPHISVSGEAFEEVSPDQATLVIGVVTERPSAVEAADDNARKTKAVLDQIAAQGVQAKDVQTLGLTLTPFSAQEQDQRAPAKRTVKGFRARNELSVTVRAIEKASEIAQRSIDSGANEVRGVTFAVSDEAAHLDRLREAAMKDAERRARSYVEAIGLKLGRVIEIHPEAEEGPLNLMRAASASADAVPLRPGVKTLSARVTVIWALAR